MSGQLTWKIRHDAGAALTYMHTAYESAVYALQFEKLDKRYRAAMLAALQSMRLEIVADCFRKRCYVVDETTRELLVKSHRSIDTPLDCSSICSCKQDTCCCDAWLWHVACDAVIRLTVCRQWDMYDVHSILAYCNFVIALYETGISVPDNVQSHLSAEINSRIDQFIAVNEMYKVFNKKRPQIAAIWTYETSAKYDKVMKMLIILLNNS